MTLPDAPTSKWLKSAVSALVARRDPALAGADIEALRQWLAQHPPARPVQARWQDARIEQEIPDGASVLDLGCGHGKLLHRLIREKKVRGQGVEIDLAAVARCLAIGVPVFQINLDEGLREFRTRSFDYVVLEETVQTLRQPRRVLEDMLRVGHYGIVSFPNFGYWRVRLALAIEGRMPVTPALPHRWYDTPNIHLFTLQDFLDWAQESGARIVRGYSLVEGVVRPLGPDDNLEAEESLLIITREAPSP